MSPLRLAAVVVLGLLLTGRAAAQEPPPPEPPPPPPAPPAPAPAGPTVPEVKPLEDRLWNHVAVDLGLFSPQLSFRLTTPVPVGASTRTAGPELFHPGIGEAVRVELAAYELPGDPGGGVVFGGAYGRAKHDDLIDNYRDLGPWMLTSRFEQYQATIDFRGPALVWADFLRLRGGVGVEALALYTDAFGLNNLLFQDAHRSFQGAGPRATADLLLPLRFLEAVGLTDWAVFGRLEGAALWGRTRLAVADIDILDGVLAGGAVTQHGTGCVPTATAVLGLGTHGQDGGLALSYEFSRWWDLGRGTGSTMDLAVHTLYLRLHWRF